MIIETFRQAIQNVWSNKLRTFLTMLGIIIGVMAVIVIVGLGNGMTKSMRDSFSAMGTNTLSVSIWGYGSRTASVDDVYNIVKKNPDLLESISPQIDFSSNTPKVGTTTYRYTNLYGVDEDYTEMKNYTLAKGRNLQYMDMKDDKQVCVIGDYINRTAFGGNGVGKTIKLGPYKFRIVGVLNAKISDPTMQQGNDDDCIYLPYTTAMRLSQKSTADSYICVMVDENQANEAKAAMENGLYNLFKSDDVAGRDEQDDQHGHRYPHGHCQHLAAGGWHRHHEHHAGVGHGADERDRHPQGHGRQGAGHPGPVRHRGRYHFRSGRRSGHRAGVYRQHGCQPGAAHVHRRHGYHGEPLVRLYRGGVRHFGGHRRAVRLPAGQACCQAQPHRRPAV